MNEAVTTRHEMASFLNERMNRTYLDLSQGRDLEPDTALVKTYLIEAHLDEGAPKADVENVLERSFRQEVLPEARSWAMKPTKDDSLHYVTAKRNREEVGIYVDSANRRFWLLHSMNSSVALDSIIRKVVLGTPELDRAWIPAELLTEASKRGAFRGLSLDYDRRKVPDVDFDAPETVAFLKMQLWGNKAAEVLKLLSQKGAFPHQTTLSKVKVKFWLGDIDRGEFAIDDIKFNGKVTARGTSFQSHVSLVGDVYGRYAEAIRSLERRVSLNWERQERAWSLRGGPVSLLLEQPIPDLSRFCHKVFSCSSPFRLWGAPTSVSPQCLRICAIDLHVGSRITFEVSPRLIRVYLPRGSCGNSVMRFYTNLQHYYDSLVKAQDPDGGPAFEFQPADG